MKNLYLVTIVLFFCAFKVFSQDVDLSEVNSIMIPKMTEYEKDSKSNVVEGTMIYQIDHERGFYFFDGSGWSKIGGAGRKPEVLINGLESAKYNLHYDGPSRVGSLPYSNAFRFISSTGYFLDITSYDTIAHNVFIYYTNENCVGRGYIEDNVSSEV